MKENFSADLSKGSVARQLIRFSLPFLASSVIQNTYSLVDMIIVGQYAGTNSLSGVTSSMQVFSIITYLIIALGTAATVLIGQHVGSGDEKGQKEIIGTAFSFLFLLSAALTVLVLLLADPINRLAQVPPESYGEARRYLVVSALGTVFISGYNAVSAVLRGMGDSRRPLYFVIIASAANIGLDFLFIAGLKMGAAGAALGTILSQGLSFAISVIYLARRKFVFDFKLRSFAIKREHLKTLLAVGTPTAILNVINSISFTIIIALTNSLGVDATASLGTTTKLVMFAIAPAQAIMSAIAAMGAQNMGAGQIERAEKTMKTGFLIQMACSVFVFAVMQLFAAPLIGIYGCDENVVRGGVDTIRTFTFDFLFVPFSSAISGLFIGAGHSLEPSVWTVASTVVVRVPVAWFFGIYLGMGLLGIGLAAPATSFFTAIVSVILYKRGGWRRNKILTQKTS